MLRELSSIFFVFGFSFDAGIFESETDLQFKLSACSSSLTFELKFPANVPPAIVGFVQEHGGKTVTMATFDNRETYYAVDVVQDLEAERALVAKLRAERDRHRSNEHELRQLNDRLEAVIPISANTMPNFAAENLPII